MRILVYGAGVQGCELAHRLAQNEKNTVTLLARGEWKERIDQKGLTIRHWAQLKTTVDRVPTIETLAPEESYDIVFVTVQAGQLPEILPILKQNKSEFFVFVGNQPHARSVLQAMQRPADKIAFGFQNNGGRRENGQVISIHAGIGMTVGGATAPLSGTFRQRLQAAFAGVKYKLTFYSDMDEWLKCHLALILPVCYVCYACNGDLTKATAEQRKLMLDAAWEGCRMLKAAGVPVNDAENTSYYEACTPGRKKMERLLFLLAKTPLGGLCASDHAMNAIDEMSALNRDLKKFFDENGAAYPTWQALEAEAGRYLQ